LQTLCLQPFYPLSGAYRNRTDDLLTARDNTGFSTVLHYTLLHYITKTMNSCFSYILHLFSVWLANYLANIRNRSYFNHLSVFLSLTPLSDLLKRTEMVLILKDLSHLMI